MVVVLVVHLEGPLQIRREFFVELRRHLTSRLDSPGRLAGVLIQRFLGGGICRIGRNRHHGIRRDGLDKFDPDLVWVDSLMVKVLCGSLVVDRGHLLHKPRRDELLTNPIKLNIMGCFDVWMSVEKVPQRLGRSEGTVGEVKVDDLFQMDDIC